MATTPKWELDYRRKIRRFKANDSVGLVDELIDVARGCHPHADPVYVANYRVQLDIIRSEVLKRMRAVPDDD
jgi:hypothetical protein